jgi:hypothetical protein
MSDEFTWREERMPLSFSAYVPMSDRLIKRYVECPVHGRQPVANGLELNGGLSHEECLPCILAELQAITMRYCDLLAAGGEDYREPKREEEMSPEELQAYRRWQQTHGAWLREHATSTAFFMGIDWSNGPDRFGVIQITDAATDNGDKIRYRLTDG